MGTMAVEQREKARDMLFHYLCYLATSASGLVHEPPIYGPYRLVDAAERLISVMGELGLSDGFLDEVGRFIAQEKETMMTDEGRFVAFLDELVEKLAGRLRDSLSQGGPCT